jgi:hypothetical protein
MKMGQGKGEQEIQIDAQRWQISAVSKNKVSLW